MALFIKNIPTREFNGTWAYTSFVNREDFRNFIKGIFKEPGEYDFDEISYEFNREARNFNEKGIFCDAPRHSKDYIEYWDSMRERCRKGVIFKGANGKVWYLTRYYYHWINFLHIGAKISGKFEFPTIWDTQYHVYLYDILAELHYKNNVTLKKRQIAWSYMRMCKMYNNYIFENSYVGKLVASNKKYIDNTNGSWKMLNEYSNFTNKHTAWACGNSPDKVFEWQQKVELKTEDGRKIFVGTDATIIGITTDKDPASPVGGRVSELNYEEGGIAPTADETYGYMLAAMKQGNIITGMFTLGGSVGALDQCGPLKKFLLAPDDNDFYGIDSNLLDENGTTGITGLFIPEQWSYPPYIDKYGNSQVEQALDYLNNYYAEQKVKKSPEEYQLIVSQGPRNIKEAFAMRTVSKFPAQHTNAQIRRIEEGEYPIEYVDLIRNESNKIEMVPSQRRPINKYPLDMKTEDKRGVTCIYEPPVPNPPPNMYICVIDPVETGKTHTSPSLAAATIYKLDTIVSTEEIIERPKTGKENMQSLEEQWGPMKLKKPEVRKDIKVTEHLEGGGEVASWCGRYDDPDETNEQLSRLVELYNAKVMCENNKPGFISYMRSKKRQKYLAMKHEMLFDKEMNVVQNSHQPYGVGMTPRLWKQLLDWGIDSLSEVLREEYDEEGNVIKIHYGVERIKDIMLLKEMQAYEDGMNVDRLVTYCILRGWIKSLQAAGLIRKKIERAQQELGNPSDFPIFKEKHDPLYNNIGRGNNGNAVKWKRGGFRNLR